MHRYIKLAAICLGIVIILFFTIPVGIHLYLGTGPGAQRLMDFINGLIPGKISGRLISVSLFKQTADIREAVLSGPDNKTILKAERATVSLNLPELLKHRLVFKVIRLEHPEITLAIEAGGELNIVNAFKDKNSPKSALNVFINNLDASDGILAFRLKDKSEIVRMQEAKLNLSASFAGDVLLNIDIPSARSSFYLSGREACFETGSVSGSIVNDRINDIRISMRKTSSSMNLSGMVSDLSDKPVVNAFLELDADMTDFNKGLRLPASFNGRLSASLKATGVYDNPSVAGDISYIGKIPAFSENISTKSGWPGTGAISFSGTLADRRLKCTSARFDFVPGLVLIEGDIDLSQVFPHSYFEAETNWDAIAYDLAIASEGIRLSDLTGAMRGTLVTDLKIKGHGIKPVTLAADISGKTWVAGFSTGKLKKTDINFAGYGKYSGRTILLDPVTVSAAGSSLTAQGTVNIGSREIEGTLNLEAPGIERLLKLFSIDAGGAVSGKAAVTGTLSHPSARFTLKGDACTWKDIALDEVLMEASLNPSGSLTIYTGTIRNHASRITGSGTLGIFSEFPHLNRSLPFNLAADLDKVNPLDFSSRLRLSGAVDGHITASGSRSQLSGDILINGHDCNYDGMPLGNIELDAGLRKGLLDVEYIGIEKGRSLLNASGAVHVLHDNSISMIKDPDIDMKITEGRIFLEDFFKEASGNIDLSGEVSGTLNHLDGSAALAGKNLSYGVQKIKELNLDARLENDRIIIEPVQMVIATDQVIRGNGWLSLGGKYAFEASSLGIALTSISYLEDRPELTGTIGINISGSGTLENPGISGKLSLSEMKYMDMVLPDGDLKFDLNDHILNAAGTLGLDFTGSLDTRTRNYTAKATFNRTDLAPLFVLADKPALKGEASGTFKAEGRIGHIQDIDINADISGLSIFHGNKPLIKADTITGSYTDGTLVLPVTHLILAEIGSLNLSGSGTIRNGLVFDAEGSVPVEVIGAFVEDLDDASGTIRFSSQVRSQNARTGIKALFTLDNCTWQIPYNGQSIHALNGLIRMDDGTVTISGLSGSLDTGSFTIDGTAILEGYRRLTMIDVRASTKALPLVFPDIMDLSLDGDAELKTRSMKPQINADVVILDGTYYRDVNLNLLTGVVEGLLPKRKHSIRRTETLPPFIKDMTLDVRMKRRGEVKIDNNVALIELNPDLEITGTVGDPLVNGRISVINGTVIFQNNTFTVTRGVIDFLNPNRTEANLDIISQTKVRDWTIYLSLEGPLDNLKMQLSSQPTEVQSDIVSLLVMGKTFSELTQKNEAAKASPSLMAAELLTSTYGSEIKKAANIDILKLEYSSPTGSKTSNDMKFTVGKDISKRFSISYEMETRNNVTSQWGIVSYKLFDNLMVNGYPGTSGNYGAEFQFKHEFR
jgi:autotransporter translocation and assembly factor TamB